MTWQRIEMGRPAIAASIVAVFAGCGLCSDDALVAVFSPDRRYEARAFVRNCGATTPYVTHVELSYARRWFRNPVSVYTATGEHPIDLVWTSNEALSIRCRTCPSARGDEPGWNNVTVELVGALD